MNFTTDRDWEAAAAEEEDPAPLFSTSSSSSLLRIPKLPPPQLPEFQNPSPKSQEQQLLLLLLLHTTLADSTLSIQTSTSGLTTLTSTSYISSEWYAIHIWSKYPTTTTKTTTTTTSASFSSHDPGGWSLNPQSQLNPTQKKNGRRNTPAIWVGRIRQGNYTTKSSLHEDQCKAGLLRHVYTETTGTSPQTWMKLLTSNKLQLHVYCTTHDI